MIKTDNTHTVKSLLPGFHDNSSNATTVDTVNIENEDNNNCCICNYDNSKYATTVDRR